jgi:hypothetical protein
VRFGPSLDLVRERLAAISDDNGERQADPPWDRLWSLERPEWELK